MLDETQPRFDVTSFGESMLRLSVPAGQRLEVASALDVIDRIGAGDALAEGVIHGWLDGDLATGLRMGTVLAVLALSQHGDMVVTNPEELRSLLTSPRRSVTR